MKFTFCYNVCTCVNLKKYAIDNFYKELNAGPGVYIQYVLSKKALLDRGQEDTGYIDEKTVSVHFFTIWILKLGPIWILTVTFTF